MNKTELKKLLTGTLYAGLIPLFGLSVFYFIKFSSTDVTEYFKTLEAHGLIAPVISLSLLPNILLFFRYLNRNKYREGYGVIFALLLWGSVIVYYKILL